MNFLQIFITAVRFLPFVSAFLCFIFILGFYILKRRSPKKFLKFSVFFVVSAIFLQSMILSLIQYYVWSTNELSKFFLPPSQPISYFLRYSWQNFWFKPIIIFSLIGLLIVICYLINKYFNYRGKKTFLTPSELYLFILSSYLVSWPGFLLFFFLFIILTLSLFFLSRIFFAEKTPNSAIPIFLAAIIVLFDLFLFDSKLIHLLKLDLLRV